MRHHGLDLVDPGTRYSAGHFARDAEGWLADVRGRGRLPVVVGGTGLYIRALAEGLFREPALDPARRRGLDAFTARLEDLELLRWAGRLDPGFPGRGAPAGRPGHRDRAPLGPPALVVAAGGARAGRAGPVVHCAHRAPARAASADRAAGGGDDAARTDRGSGVGAGRGPRAAGAGTRRHRDPRGGRVPARQPHAGIGGGGHHAEHTAVRQTAADLVPPPARRGGAHPRRDAAARAACGGDRRGLGERRGA